MWDGCPKKIYTGPSNLSKFRLGVPTLAGRIRDRDLSAQSLFASDPYAWQPSLTGRGEKRAISPHTRLFASFAFGSELHTRHALVALGFNAYACLLPTNNSLSDAMGHGYSTS
jgi:hypothetical protein